MIELHTTTYCVYLSAILVKYLYASLGTRQPASHTCTNAVLPLPYPLDDVIAT